MNFSLCILLACAALIPGFSEARSRNSSLLSNGNDQQCCDPDCCSYCDSLTTPHPNDACPEPEVCQECYGISTFQDPDCPPFEDCGYCHGVPTCLPCTTCDPCVAVQEEVSCTCLPCLEELPQSPPVFSQAFYQAALPSWPKAGAKIDLQIEADTEDNVGISYKLEKASDFLNVTPEGEVIFKSDAAPGNVGGNNVMIFGIQAYVTGEMGRQAEATVVLAFPRSLE